MSLPFQDWSATVRLDFSVNPSLRPDQVLTLLGQVMSKFSTAFGSLGAIFHAGNVVTIQKEG